MASRCTLGDLCISLNEIINFETLKIVEITTNLLEEDSRINLEPNLNKLWTKKDMDFSKLFRKFGTKSHPEHLTWRRYVDICHVRSKCKQSHLVCGIVSGRELNLCSRFGKCKQ